jgi:prepilin-type processing-associated H-X9-DG protein/prepilin-type N-terminal cleavage/methylation domain-containing protein
MNRELPCLKERSSGTAFTLIELLVVIAMVAVLSSLLLPALSGSKRATHTAACKSRLRQIGIALSLYTADFAVYPNVIEKLERYLVRNRPELGDSSSLSRATMFGCPTRVTYRLNVYGSLPWPESGAPTNSSLGLALTRPTDPASGPFLPDHGVAVPSDMFASGDTVVSGWGEPVRDPLFNEGLHFRPRYAHRPTRDTPEVAVANMLFCDGHVEDGRKPVWEAKSEAARRRWNRDHKPHNENFRE